MLRVAFFAVAVSVCVPASAGTSADLTKQIDAYIAPFVAGNNFPGAILVARGDTVLFNKAYGMANYELGVANTPRSRFHIASLTKMFTAAATLLLEEDGKLQTSDAVSKFIPDYPNGDKIHLEQLLTHTAGIPNPNFSEGEGRTHLTAEQLVAKFRDKPLDFEPGSQTRYSNGNYNLLALIIEKVSGQPYSSFVKSRVIDPLHLTSTINESDAADLIERRATGTVPDGFTGVKNAPWVEWSTKTGSGSLVSTTEDLFRFVRAELGGRLLKPESLAKVTMKRSGFPYGWSQSTLGTRKRFASGGRSPGYVSAVQYYPDDEVTIVVLTNSYSSMAQDPVVDDVARIVFGEKPQSGPVAAIKPRPGQLAGIAGRYQFDSMYYSPNAIVTLVDRGDHIDAQWQQGPTNVIYPVTADEFLDRGYWARVKFERDANGRVTAFHYRLVQDFIAKRID